MFLTKLKLLAAAIFLVRGRASAVVAGQAIAQRQTEGHRLARVEALHQRLEAVAPGHPE